ncbi:MAG TPA: hypothetical protein PLG90_05990 [Ignavibacteria bacterium]|nr:hypothetical protein [Ignavibacteria bacterium]
MFKKTLIHFLILISFIYYTGCSDNPVTPEIHFDAEGMMLVKDNGDTVMYFFRGDLKQGFDTLKVPNGTITPHLKVFFLDKDRNRIDPPVSNSNYSLGYAISNPSVISVFVDNPSNTFEFHLRGLQTGTSSIRFNLLHGNHSDFTTTFIPVIVDSNIIGEAIGFKITYEKSGEVIFDYPGSGMGTGSGFTLAIGDTTEHAVIQFYDKKGNLFTPPYPQYDIAGFFQMSSIATFINEAPDEPFVFRTVGNSSGNTKLIINLTEGSETLYTTNPTIDFTVTP